MFTAAGRRIAAAAIRTATPALSGILGAATLGATMAHETAPVLSSATVGPAKPKVLFVLGGPGAGKGTQCANLVRDYGFVHLSAGDLLRAERASGSSDADLINHYIKEGKIVPVEITVKLIKKAMAASGASKFLVDGFPRNFNNLEGWYAVMGDEAEVAGVLMFEASEAVMEARLLERGKTSGRDDDNIASIKKRFKTYLDETLPVIAHFAGQGKVLRVRGEQPVDKVYADTRSAVGPIVADEVAKANARLLAAIHASDWDAYVSLCAPDLTAFEAESNGALVTGLAFHKFHFDQAAAARKASGAPPSSSVMNNVNVRLLSPTSAVVVYDRLVQKPGASVADAHAETRVWQYEDHRWRNVHFHRSPQKAAEAKPAH